MLCSFLKSHFRWIFLDTAISQILFLFYIVSICYLPSADCDYWRFYRTGSITDTSSFFLTSFYVTTCILMLKTCHLYSEREEQTWQPNSTLDLFPLLQFLYSVAVLSHTGSAFLWKNTAYILKCMDVRIGPYKRLSTKELMFLNCGATENSWKSLGL